MTASQPTVEALLDRMGGALSDQLFPFVVVSIIQRTGTATRDQIAAGLEAAAGGKLDFSARSQAHLLGRLEKTFGLIARAGPDAYTLTDKGEALYAATLAQVIAPLRGILPPE